MSRKSIHCELPSFTISPHLQLLGDPTSYQNQSLYAFAQKVLSTYHGWVSAENQRVGVIHVITNMNQKMIHSVMKEMCMKTKESLEEKILSMSLKNRFRDQARTDNRYQKSFMTYLGGLSFEQQVGRHSTQQS
jgi:hypothetical protein